MKPDSISFARMQKAEFSQFAKDMLLIVEKHKTEEMNLQVVNHLLSSTMPAIKAMKVRQPKHELTVPLNALHAERYRNANMIVSLLRVYMRDNDRSAYVQKVESCIFLHLANIGSMSQVKVSENLEMFFAVVEANAGIAEAFEALGFSTYVQKAKAAHLEYCALNQKRRIDINKKAERLTLQARAVVGKNARTALQLIESAVLLYPDVDYGALITELNALIAQYKVKIKARATRNDNKLLNATTAASSSKTVAAAE